MTEPARIERYAAADVPTEYGFFKIVVYREPSGAEHVAIVKGEVGNAERVHVRVHSECLTGEVFHSLKCDCREQLDHALRHIADEERGIVIYLRQEGRGIGLGNKIRAYALQQQGADTVDANRMLGFEDDLRSYRVAADMLRDLDVRSVMLLTNNPAKVDGLRKDGVNVVDRLPVEVEPNPHNREYLLTKRARMGHWLEDLNGILFDAE
jgi:GTP cyclohydrolase II